MQKKPKASVRKNRRHFGKEQKQYFIKKKRGGRENSFDNDLTVFQVLNVIRASGMVHPRGFD